ncbi:MULTISPECIES: acetate--CoA ligase family protein [unclassified Streptomyces]|uniref:acetate--CoA ligase family protein n=1 Tax=unclassified Streptomyces TaxID=2593676 RepID=UPI0030E31CD0
MPEYPSRPDGLTALLRPRSVVVLGASAKKRASGNDVLRNLRQAGYDGDLHVVHPVASSVEGLEAVPDIGALPTGIDAGVVSLPTPAVLDALRGLEKAGCRSALVPTAGLDAATALEVARFAAASDMTVHGPNCMGVINLTDRVPLWISDSGITRLPAGNVALVAQSGSAAIFIAHSTGPVRYSKIVSTGGEYGATTAAYLSWLARDPATTAAGVLLESIKDVPSFVEGVAAMRAAGKPVVVLKVGRSSVGSAATTAHTGALIGSGAAYQALFDQLDLPVVTDYDEMAAVLQCLAVPELPAAAGTRVGVITISGGQAALTADLAADRGLTVPRFAEATARGLESAMPGAPGHNPFDAGGSVEYPDGGFRRSVELIAADDDVDSVLVVLDAQATMTDAETDYEADEFRAARAVAESAPGKPVVVASSSALSVQPRCEEQAGPAVPVLRGIGNALVALQALARNRQPVADGVRPGARWLPEAEAVEALKEEVAQHRGALSADLTRRLLALYGLPLVESAVVPDADAAVRWADEHGYPLVVKVSSPDVPHRSDVGGVVLGVADEAALRQAVEDIAAQVRAAHPEAVIEGFEIQQQVAADSTEALLGFVADPVFGAVTTVGTGGTLVELYADTASALSPVGPDEAAALINRTRLGTLLGGYRNLLPKTDTSPLADAAHRLSLLGTDFAGLLTEADLNPAFVQHGTGRVLIADSLLVARND